ncbi:short chain dehydrogenase [Endozoicomonas sp. OPT23]|uniref:SDR family NAD(P)-dependent oxidoreductase n=1 Tax=Endozoicomonas sp. OPT23 TaxID=2072845 RepID=UPI00129A68AC|nr:SDR family NAD(P)-dependent oxidoreductase [Endozoicomonas sp. OPT23]MRI35085.1 short chain dehydrogenase [Endozoicomonas sp. OPT23]
MNILIIGGSGGIGLAIIQQSLSSYPQATITATYHSQCPEFKHSQLKWLKLDVTSEKDIIELSKHFDSLNMLINAVGFLHSSHHSPEKALSQFDADFFQTNISLNTLPSILLAKHFMAALRSESVTYFVTLSARIGSISDNQMGGWLSYRTSKAALNMAMKTVSIEWKQKLPNCCIVLFHPGTTDTGLSKPFQRNLPAGQLQSPEFTAKSLVEVIRKLRTEDSGRLLDYDGNNISW